MIQKRLGKPMLHTIKIDTRIPLKDLANAISKTDSCHLEFSGWNNDGREIPEIPKARDYLSCFFDEYAHLYPRLDEGSRRLVMLSWCKAKVINRDNTNLQVDWAIDPQVNKIFDSFIKQL